MHTRLKILEPCTQDWNKMTNLDKNKFCNKCEKEVIDFTGYRKEEILKVLKKNPNLCGRLEEIQLKENYLSKNKTNSYLSKLTFLIGLGTIIGITEPVIAKPVEHKTELKERKDWKSVLPQKKLNDSMTLEGKVLDADNLPLPGAIVHFKGSKIGTQTDYDGKFSITIPADKLNNENILIFSFVGFKTIEYRFYTKNRFLKVQMEDDTTFLGEVIIVREQNIFRKIGYFFHNLFSNHKTCN